MKSLSQRALSQHPENDEFARRIAELVPEGLMAPEIAARLGIPHRRVHRIAKSAGIDLGRGLGANARRLHVVVPSTLLPALDEIAAGAKVDRSEMARRIMISVLDTSRAAALKQLGRLGKPKRRIRTREEIELAKSAEMAARAAAAEAEAESRSRMPEWLREAIAAGRNPVRAIRIRLGLRLIDVARQAGLGANGARSIGSVERGAKNLTPRLAEPLAKALGVEPAWLNGGSSRSSPSGG